MASCDGVWHHAPTAFGRALAVPPLACAVASGASGGSPAQVATAPSATTAATATAAKPKPAKAPNLVSARHHGRTFTVARGRELELRLAPGAEARTTGRSVRLSPIDFFVDPGYTAWMVSAVSRGTTVLSGRSGGKAFRITLVVR